MTTIAWDGRTLASDSLCTKVAGLRMNVEKFRRVELLGGSCVYAMAGDLANCLVLANWWEAHPGDVLTWPENLIDEGTYGMLVRDDGQVWEVVVKPNVLIPIPRGPHAIGSGRDYALAAMALGKTAPEAVELAARFDAWTGGPVVEMTLGRSASVSAGAPGPDDPSRVARLTKEHLERLASLARPPANPSDAYRKPACIPFTPSSPDRPR